MGTPYNAVHFSVCTALSVARGSNASDGNTIEDPWVADAM